MAKYQNDKFNLEDIYKRYFIDKESIHKISKIYNVTSKVIKRIIQKNYPNNEIRNCSEAQKVYFKTHDGVMKGKQHSEESKQKMKENRKMTIGKNNPAWNGGRRISKDGYILIYKPDHPFKNKKVNVIPEHRYIVEKWLRENEPNSKYLISVENHIDKFLDPQVVIHHINGIKNDNSLENLQLVENNSLHIKIHQENPFLNSKTKKICYEDIIEYNKRENNNKNELVKYFNMEWKSIKNRLNDPIRYSRKNLQIVLNK